MAPIKFTGSLSNNKGKHIDVEISLLRFQQGGSYIIYAPALELYGYGKTVQEAMSSFEVSLEEFFRYTLSKDTLFSELRKMGWEIGGKKNNIKFTTPSFSKLLSTNENLTEIINNRSITTFKKDIPMAIPA